MKINLVFPNLYTPLSFSPAIQMLSAVLKRGGHKTTLTHIHKDMVPDDNKKILENIRKNKPDLIGFTSTSFEYNRVNEIAKYIKRYLNTPIILGGVHATISFDDYYESNFDAFIVGEGEKTIVEIAEERIKPKGIIYGETIYNLDELPFYDWDIMDSRKILKAHNNWLDIRLSRGCPFNCHFCANPIIRKIKKTTEVRRRNVKNCIDELLCVISRFNPDVINFSDDEFILNKKWLLKFLKEYKKKINLRFVIEARADTFSEEKAKTLKEANCYEIQFGVESGSNKIRQFLNKNESDKIIEKAFDLCRKYNIRTYAYIMIGIPTETEKDIKKTLKFLAKIKPNLIRITFLCPVKGTVIYDYCKDHNMIRRDIKVWNYESPLELDSIDNEILMKYWHNFPEMINHYMKGNEYYIYKEEKNKKTFRFNRLELVNG